MSNVILLLYPSDSDIPLWAEDYKATVVLASSQHQMQQQIERMLEHYPDVQTMVFWDTRLGQPSAVWLEAFEESQDDAWHPGSLLGGADDDSLFPYVAPGGYYSLVPNQAVDGHVNWRLTPHATLVRATTMRQLGNLETGFETLAGALYQMGWRWLQKGAILRQKPALLSDRPALCPQVPSLADHYRLIGLWKTRFWLWYIWLRRSFSGAHTIQELIAMQRALLTHGSRWVQVPHLTRNILTAAIPDNPSISVVLPTVGRYRYVAEVLADIRDQTIPVTQILIADGNDVPQPEVYEEFRDLPLEVIWLKPHERGTCGARNTCLQRATGDYIWFVDDDSRFEPDNLEMHFRVMASYGADISVGPTYTSNRPELYSSQQYIICAFMGCGTTLAKRSILAQAGAFDMNLNYLTLEDGEIGDRFVRAGGVMLNNPYAKHFHYLAPIGGMRTTGNSPMNWTRWVLRPRPPESVYYRLRRHYGHLRAREGLLRAWMLFGWKRKDGEDESWHQRLTTLLLELLALPISLIRLGISMQRSRQMLRRGPQIPSLSPSAKHSSPLVDQD